MAEEAEALAQTLQAAALNAQLIAQLHFLAM
jgi:hypothetical protein